jgi:hypothetical protein
MTENKRKTGITLIWGATIASLFNFYSFILLPTFVGTESLGDFIRDNYLGGFYLFGIAASVSPLSIFILTEGKFLSFQRYLTISIFCLFAIGGGGFWLDVGSGSLRFALLAAAFGMHSLGFFLASMIRQERFLGALVLQAAQPVIFGILLTINEVGELRFASWSVLYVLSVIFPLTISPFFIDRQWIFSTLGDKPMVGSNWSSIIFRMVLAVSFSFFFQVELIIGGLYSPLNLGDFGLVQRLYSSISISIFGAIGVRLIFQQLELGKGKVITVNFTMLTLAVIVSFAVLGVGYSLLLFNSFSSLTLNVVALCAIASFLFTIANFLSLSLVSFKPTYALISQFISFFIYFVLFYFVAPKGIQSFLALSCIYFFTYIVSALLCQLNRVDLKERAI